MFIQNKILMQFMTYEYYDLKTKLIKLFTELS